MTKIRRIFFLGILLFPLTLHASFIESTLGTAVVNDASATYYNPAGLTLLKTSQFIALGSISDLHTHFTGQFIQSGTGFTQSGSSDASTHYYLPSFYLGMPTKGKITLGLAVVSNFFDRNVGENSILRYTQSSNNVQNFDLVPAMGIKINECLSVGMGINFSYAHFLLQPISGFPSLNIPDSQSRNECNGTGLGGDIGIILKPSPSTILGFNYRSAITYRLHGKSILEGNPELISNAYSFNFWTPARSVFSINHFVTRNLGFIGTIQYIQWNIFKEINIHGIATQINSQPMILNADVPYHFHNTWLFTVGTHYRVTKKWVVRIASSYTQSPETGNYQLSTGDSITVGASTGYEITKNIILDGSYAHAFIRNKNINITNNRNVVTGTNKASVDGCSLKLTFNV